METQTLLTVAQVAEKLELSTSKAYDLMRSRELPTVQIGRLMRVLSDDLDAFVLSHRVTDEKKL